MQEPNELPPLDPSEERGDPSLDSAPREQFPAPQPASTPEPAANGWTYADLFVVIGFALITQVLVNIGLFLVVLAVGWVGGARSNPTKFGA